MNTSKNKALYIYGAKDYNGNIVAEPMRNSLMIAGKGVNRVSFVDSIIMYTTMFNNWRDLSIYILDAYGHIGSTWSDHNISDDKYKGISHIQDCYDLSLVTPDYLSKTIIDTIEQCVLHHIEEHGDTKKMLFILDSIISKIKALDNKDEVLSRLYEIIKQTEDACFIVTDIESVLDVIGDNVNVFRFLYVLRCSDDVSLKLFDDFRASKDMPRNGGLWIKDIESEICERYDTIFCPNTLLEKYRRTFSVAKDR